METGPQRIYVCDGNLQAHGDHRATVEEAPDDTPPEYAVKFRKDGKPLPKPIAIHCPYCAGKVIFVRSEQHLDRKNCPHCGMEVERKWGLA